ncbi:Eukaryotic translation initiation factor 4B3-like protein [Drosera capensis]
MAATVSSVWAKPDSWALESEQQGSDPGRAEPSSDSLSAEFPSLAAAASTKTTKKKKKPQTLSLAEFTSSSFSAATANRLTVDEILVLPKAPRERTAEELERPRGFRDFGDLRNNRSRVDGGGFGDRDRDRERDSGFSMADEVDDWSKGKGTGVGGGSGVGGYERRERNGGGLFSSSRADEADNWGSNKSFVPSFDGRRDRRMGFESNGGADSENWGRRKEEEFDGRRYDRDRRGGFEVDSERWGRKEEEVMENGIGNGGGVRLRLNLQPRTLPLNGNGNGQVVGKEEKVVKEEKAVKGANPFGAARPREEVLAEKGKDWKEIEERLEAKKGEEFDRPRSRGLGRGRGERGDNGKFERSWRRDDSVDARPHSASTAEKIENGVAALIDKEEGAAAQDPPEDGVESPEED